jgi:hypothetical protein
MVNQISSLKVPLVTQIHVIWSKGAGRSISCAGSLERTWTIKNGTAVAKTIDCRGHDSGGARKRTWEGIWKLWRRIYIWGFELYIGENDRPQPVATSLAASGSSVVGCVSIARTWSGLWQAPVGPSHTAQPPLVLPGSFFSAAGKKTRERSDHMTSEG